MTFKQEIPPSSLGQVLSLINATNLSSERFYWIAVPGLQILEFRTASIIGRDEFDEEHYRNTLRELIDQGLTQYDYLKRMFESPGTAVN